MQRKFDYCNDFDPYKCWDLGCYDVEENLIYDENGEIIDEDPPMGNKPGATKKPATNNKPTAKPYANKPTGSKPTTTKKPVTVPHSVGTEKPVN